MGDDWIHNKELIFDIEQNKVSSGSLFSARNEIFIFISSERMETVFHDISKSHFLVRLDSVVEMSLNFAFESSIVILDAYIFG